MRWVSLLSLAAITACSAAAAVSSPHEAEVVSVTPSTHAIAVSTIFFGCPVETDEKATCFACDVTLHDTEEGGLVAFASHWKHDLKPWDGRDRLQVTVSGEVADTKFTAAVQTEEAAAGLFGEAETWCAERGKGNYHLLKNEIDTAFGGAE